MATVKNSPKVVESAPSIPVDSNGFPDHNFLNLEYRAQARIMFGKALEAETKADTYPPYSEGRKRWNAAALVFKSLADELAGSF